jgi:hypothetical protein
VWDGRGVGGGVGGCFENGFVGRAPSGHGREEVFAAGGRREGGGLHKRPAIFGVE